MFGSASCSRAAPAAKPADQNARQPAPPAVVDSDLYRRITKEGKIRIGVKADSPPFGVESHGIRRGFDIDIAALVARHLGAEPVFVTVTSADRIPRLLAGEVDIVIASMTQTRSRERQVDFSIPYFEDGPAILMAAGSGVEHYAQFGERRLGVAKGSSTAASIKKFLPEARIVELPTIKDLLPALDAKQVDGVASDYLILLG
ncbi:MAG: transporter substrate-binding domain-containing protein, partial [Burkholderiaceae bacterium]|nr:transporter substrate-binding domain-containing protein [Burkholderiaceae bacterium]